MSVYTRNQPVAKDDLDISQPFLVNNTNSADDIFGLEHYAFSNMTVNKGLHKTVTTPDSVTAPVTVGIPILFGLQITTNLGTLQFSKGPTANPALPTVPTPITGLQGSPQGDSIGPGASINILNFAGMPGTIVKAYAYDLNIICSEYLICWNAATLLVVRIGGTSGLFLSFVAVGSTLTLKNATAGTLLTLWSLDFKRIG